MIAPPITPEQRFYDAIVSAVDPETFDGTRYSTCFLGQLGGKRSFTELSKEFGVPWLSIQRIFDWSFDYGTDLEGAKAMARRVLGIEETP